ncbi:hypothetical protein PHYPSEUDO_009526 [Phytophthora pseudosyringae]|uniref:Uncharacterized protein n=1 Tax=Phytophthora pseudosyringae TaxID=221518 RepID=A0A8T1VBV8_9STRA|nr:hypothetical protein PHYPSEUDO_009526 [Phytophthora pseudosyringae]
MLSRSCERNKIEAKGTEALSGADLDRYQSLAAANALVPLEQQLKLCIARLQFTFSGYYGEWGGSRAQQTASWYSLGGQKLGNGKPPSLEWTEKLNFLNPGDETLGQLWKQFDSTGVARHERFAIVGWPTHTDIQSTFDLMGDVAAAEMTLADSPVDMTKVQQFLHYRAGQQRQVPYGYNNGYAYSAHEYSSPMPLQFCQKLCKAIADSGCVALVDAFFKTCFSRLKEKHEMIPVIAELIRKVGWEHVADPYMKAVDQHHILHADRL